jgi:cytochrome c-type biogenesis protein
LLAADIIQTGLSSWWAPALAFAAGLVSFASPCVFPLVPGNIAFVSGGADTDEKPLVPILLFIAGFATVFTLLGAFLAHAHWFAYHKDFWLRVAGFIIMAFGLFMIFYAFRLGRPGLYAERRPFLERARPGRLGAFPLGMAFAVGWTPCIGPVLGGILTLAAAQGGWVRGAALLFSYSMGLGVPFLLVGLGLSKLKALEWVKRHYSWIAGVSGALMLVIGFLMVTGLWLRLLNPVLNAIRGFTPAL